MNWKYQWNIFQKNSKYRPVQTKWIESIEVLKLMLIYLFIYCRARLRTIEPITFEESERRALLQKEWARFKGHERREDIKIIAAQLRAQEKALAELRLESEQLYKAAIDIDPKLVPFKAVGPVVTPPIDKYVSPVAYRCKFVHASMLHNHYHPIYSLIFLYLYSIGWRLYRC